MAGYTLGFDDGGTVDDDDTPTIPTDASNAQPAQDNTPDPADAGNGQSPEAQGAPAQPGFVPGGAPGIGRTVNGGVKKIVSYLMGEGAADPQTAKKFEQGIKAENPGISDDDANLLAVHKAHELGGPAAAWQMVQYNRAAYNAKQSFAKAALNGIDGKAGNVQAAAQAATQAGQHILDGSATVFTADPRGGGSVNAQVKMPGTNRSLTFQLNPQQFNQWLDVGGQGMWDRVMEQGTPQSLQKIAGQQAQDQGGDNDNAAPAASPAGATPPSTKGGAEEDPTDTAIKMANDDNQDSDPAETELNPNANQPTNIGKTPSSLNLSGSDRQSQTLAPPPHSYGNDLESAGRAMFPSISQEQQRQQWMAQQQNERSERIAKTGQAAMGARARMNVAHETGVSREKAADTRAGGQVQSAQARAGGQVDAAKVNADARSQGYAQRANAAALKLASTAKTAEEAENNKNFRAAILNNPSASDAQVDGWAKKFGVKLPNAPQAAAPQATTPTGQQPAAQASSSSVPPAAQRQVGFTTTTSKGTFKWNGSGWEKQ